DDQIPDLAEVDAHLVAPLGACFPYLELFRKGLDPPRQLLLAAGQQCPGIERRGLHVRSTGTAPRRLGSAPEPRRKDVSVLVDSSCRRSDLSGLTLTWRGPGFIRIILKSPMTRRHGSARTHAMIASRIP